MADETSIDVAYAHAAQNLTGQRARLDNVRMRAAAIITAASVIASFLGGQALADTKAVPGVSSPVSDRSLQVWEIVGFGAFLAALACSAWIIKPKSKGWAFTLSSTWILEDGDKTGAVSDPAKLPEQRRRLTTFMQQYYDENDKKLDRLYRLLALSVAALAVEALGFMLDLTT